MKKKTPVKKAAAKAKPKVGPTPEQKAGQDAVKALKKSVLAAVRKARGEVLGTMQVSERAGIVRAAGPIPEALQSPENTPPQNTNDSITTGILCLLQAEGKVKRARQANGRGGWIKA